MSATAKFYSGFVIVAALVIALAFYAGYRAGYAAHRTPVTVHRQSVP
jgi:hypothetical protein